MVPLVTTEEKYSWVFFFLNVGRILFARTAAASDPPRGGNTQKMHDDARRRPHTMPLQHFICLIYYHQLINVTNTPELPAGGGGDPLSSRVTSYRLSF